MSEQPKTLVGIVLVSLLAVVMCILGLMMGSPAAQSMAYGSTVASTSAASAAVEQLGASVKPTRIPEPEKPYASSEAVDWDFVPTRDPEEFYFDVAARGDDQEAIDGAESSPGITSGIARMTGARMEVLRAATRRCRPYRWDGRRNQGARVLQAA